MTSLPEVAVTLGLVGMLVLFLVVSFFGLLVRRDGHLPHGPWHRLPRDRIAG